MHCLTQGYKGFVHLGCFLKPYFLLAIRLFWGYALFKIGMAKFHDMPATVQLFNSVNIPYAHLLAPIVATVEVLGGIALFLGLFARLLSIPVIVVLLTALATVHVGATKDMFVNQMQFMSQNPVTFLLVALTVLCVGPGCFSIDALLKKACCNCDECTKR